MPTMPQCDDGVADRTAGIGAERAVAKAGGQRGAGTAARAAGNMRGVPRISDGGEGRVDRRPAEGELMHAEFAEQDRAGILKLCHRRRVVIGKPIFQHRRVASRADAFGGVEIFQRDRNAMQRPAIFAAV